MDFVCVCLCLGSFEFWPEICFLAFFVDTSPTQKLYFFPDNVCTLEWTMVDELKNENRDENREQKEIHTGSLFCGEVLVLKWIFESDQVAFCWNNCWGPLTLFPARTPFIEWIPVLTFLLNVKFSLFVRYNWIDIEYRFRFRRLDWSPRQYRANTSYFTWLAIVVHRIRMKLRIIYLEIGEFLQFPFPIHERIAHLAVILLIYSIQIHRNAIIWHSGHIMT